MAEIYELFDERQILTMDDIDNLMDLSMDNLCDFATEIETIIWNSSNEEKAQNFDFYANERTSGLGGCLSYTCKKDRFDNLALFSGLYANNVLITLPKLYNQNAVSSISTLEDVIEFKMGIISKIKILSFYRPLVEKGIVTIETEWDFCPNCTKKATSELDVNRLTLLIEYYEENASVFFSEHLGSYVVDLSAVGDIIEHKIFTRRKNEFSQQERKFIEKSIYEKRALTNEELKSLGVIGDILSSEFEKGMIDNFISKVTNRKLITLNRPIYEGKVNDADGLLDCGDFMSVKIPFVDTNNISNLLFLREREAEAFYNYRNSIVKLLKEYKEQDNIGKSKQIYEDIVLPEFSKLDVKLRSHNEKKKNQIIGTSVVFAGSLVLGNLINSPNLGLVSALHTLAVGLATTAVGDVFQSEASYLRENDYYFLWQLNRNLQR